MSCVHSRVGRSPPFGSELPRSGLVPPLPLQRLRRFTPLDTLQVCCTLHPAMGFAAFPLCSLPLARRRGAGRSASSTALYPSELSPSQQVAARHRVPMPSRRRSRVPAWFLPCCHGRRSMLSAVRSTSGLCSTAKSVAPCRRCHRRAARCSLGLAPRRVRDAGIPLPRPEGRKGLRPEGRWVARPRGPKAAWAPHGIRRLVALPEGKARPPPGIGLERNRRPEGLGPACVRQRRSTPKGRPCRSASGAARRRARCRRPSQRGTRRSRPAVGRTWVGARRRLPLASALLRRAAQMPHPLAAFRLCQMRTGPGVGGVWLYLGLPEEPSGSTSGSRRSRRRGPRLRAPKGAHPPGLSPPPEGEGSCPPGGG
jgi:hypothetical protein